MFLFSPAGLRQLADTRLNWPLWLDENDNLRRKNKHHRCYGFRARPSTIVPFFARSNVMKRFGVCFAGAVLLSGLCAAQDVSPAANDQDSGQNVVAAAHASQAQAAIAADKQANIRRLLELTDAGAVATQAMDEMEKSIRPMMIDALPPGDYRDKLVELFFQKFHEKRDPAQLLDLMVPIYDKYYSADEVKALINLYQTPLGKKMITVLPKIVAESQAAGGQWGQELGRQCMREVLEEHPDMQQAIMQAKRSAQP